MDILNGDNEMKQSDEIKNKPVEEPPNETPTDNVDVTAVIATSEKEDEVKTPSVQANLPEVTEEDETHISLTKPLGEKVDSQYAEERGVKVPHTIGNLEIIEKLGEGGMAIVFKARHRELEAERAVKILPPDRAEDQNFLNRFVREAKVAANIEHQNVVRVYNVGVDQGFHFIEMELVHGNTLTKILKKYGKLPLPVATAIIAEVAEGLNAAHTSTFQFRGQKIKGVIHRDLKPDNIMVTLDGTCKLMDLGIARPVDVNETAIGTIQGTFPYMSPEQWDGLPDIDARTDLFSLGVVFYECCSGERPFKGNSITAIMKAATQGKFEPLQKLNADAYPEVDSIINKALCPERDKRYQSACGLLNELRKVLAKFGVIDTRQLIKGYLEEGDEALKKLPPVSLPPKSTRSNYTSKKILVAAVGILLIVAASVFIRPGEPKVANVTISSNYYPVEVLLDGVKVTQPANPGDQQNFIAKNVNWGKHIVKVILVNTKQEQEISVDIEEANPVIRVDF